jgi:hypothetical protein
VSGSQRPIRISRKETVARTAVGMPSRHPELVARQPRQGEWELLATWLAELWPNDEYIAIVTDAWHQDSP